MLIELAIDNHSCVAPLFSGYPYLYGSIAAIIAGGMGTVFADSDAAPQVALAVLDFHFLAGDPTHAHAALLVPSLRPMPMRWCSSKWLPTSSTARYAWCTMRDERSFRQAH